MEVVLFMAATVNSIIARESGEEDFLSDENWQTFCNLAKEVGCFIIGRKTYESVNKWEDYSFKDIEKIKRIVVSKNLNYKLADGYILARSPKDALKVAAEEGFGRVLVTGGGNLNSVFMQLGLITEIKLNIEPVVLGKGISIFSEADFETRLELIESKKLPSGIVQLHYKVKHK